MGTLRTSPCPIPIYSNVSPPPGLPTLSSSRSPPRSPSALVPLAIPFTDPFTAPLTVSYVRRLVHSPLAAKPLKRFSQTTRSPGNPQPPATAPSIGSAPLHATRWLSKATDRGFRVRCRANLSPAHGRPEWLPRPVSAHRPKRRRIRTPVHDRGRFRRPLS